MQISKDTVVSLNYELSDLKGKVIEKTQAPITYLHGGYDGIFPLVEVALQGKSIGDKCNVTLKPDDAFGEYEKDMVRTEPKSLFPENISVGMQFEGAIEGSDDYTVYTVTEIQGEKIVVDGNHPLAGQTLVFSGIVTGVRPATHEELHHGHVHGPDGHHH
ncbi:MAG TPA: peptidylprolyl isomerase [Burkholderiales bacterium]|jgi:FKBP-type peptidyl-prolyl cis-trans isomerase SlyD|nr:peptidylprolyl isomerase [Burkholderiales bacterium]